MPERLQQGAGTPRPGDRGLLKFGALAVMLMLCVAAYAAVSNPSVPEKDALHSHPAKEATKLGINLFGPETYNRQQVYLNLIAQSEWFSSHGNGWARMPADQLDANGWVRKLKPGETAPRPFVMPPPPYRAVQVRCEYEGRGQLSADGVARIVSQSPGALMLELSPTGSEGDSAWIELVSTDPADPLRNIDCRDTSFPRGERFHPAFLAFVEGFKTVRFLDWQRVNDNAEVNWSERIRPQYSSQVSVGGTSIEDMVEVANRTGADPWFLMPYKADEEYMREFARLVHERLDPRRVVYVELGNEVWNDIFDAAHQARREGLALKLGGGDPTRAQTLRYAAKVRDAMKIWTEVFADRPQRLVRVAATQHASPDLAEVVLSDSDTSNWVDALATAPYIWFDTDGLKLSDVDRVFAAMPDAIGKTMLMAEQNREIASRHGKRLIAYEGGQHLVPRDIALARALQRDPRMAEVYRRYLGEWDSRIGGPLTLYASVAPIGEYGSWGLTEYGGQPIEQAPKLKAVRNFQGRTR